MNWSGYLKRGGNLLVFLLTLMALLQRYTKHSSSSCVRLFSLEDDITVTNWVVFVFVYIHAIVNVQEATELLKDGIDLITEADTALSNLLSYPLHSALTRYYTFKIDFCFFVFCLSY